MSITNANEFIDFVNNVNSGTNYSGTTILLDSDLSLTGKTLEPIGKSYNNKLLGVFDGQGHTIRDIKINSSSQFIGLFGHSKGLTIRNIVLDSSCSITTSSSFFASPVFMGGILGYCNSDSGECNIENSVIMADVSFSGKIRVNRNALYLGGIAGRLSSSIYMKNCANYGSVTHSGDSGDSSIGGIAGEVDGLNICNCINYGTITHGGTTSSNLYLGTIVGASIYAYIENCVSAGEISTQNTPTSSYIGGIVGYVDSYSYTYVNYCYYTSDLNKYNLYGTGTPESTPHTLSYDNITFELNGTVSVGSYTGSSLIDALNAAADYYILRDYSKWLLNKDRKTVKFTINSRTSPITMDYQIILLPNFANKGNVSFDGWYNDSECTNPLESFEITEDKTLYGRFEENTNNYTITFNTRREGSSVAPQTAHFGVIVALPCEFIREHCSVAFWENEYGDNVGLNLIMPAHNFTLHAVWKCTHIRIPEDFIDFSKIVNSGTDDYSGKTVLLDSDIGFVGGLSQQFEMIGKDYNYFRGTFDGQGHAIRNLAINTSSSYQLVGLFGVSTGTAIRNVVIDKTCSFTNNFISNEYGAYTGGIIGECDTYEGPCTLENNVNMADVTFNGNTNESFAGGIAGMLILINYQGAIKNCANYGTVSSTGTNNYGAYIGGIIGSPQKNLPSSTSLNTHVQNCANYGTLFYKGSSNDVNIGGISGYSDYSTIENCVSYGSIVVDSSGSGTKIVGSIAGAALGSNITHCYWNASIVYDVCGYKYSSTITNSYSFDPSTFELAGSVSIGNYAGTSLIGALNGAANYYFLREYSHWALNKDSRDVSFTVNKTKLSFTTNAQVILLPDLAGGGNMSFSGWYTDSACTVPLTGFTIDSDEKKDLYGLWGAFNYTINFNTQGGSSISSITSPYGSTVEMPTSTTRSGCSFLNWETEYGYPVTTNSFTVPSRNITLYAVWLCERITTARDLIGFSDVVNSGTNFIGTTVYLDSDIDFTDELSQQFEVIGKNGNNYFRGTFDGRGHVIRNLTINAPSSYQYVGLFGGSIGTIIQNVVIDETCSFVNNYVSEYYDAYIGSIAGYFNTHDGSCTLENNVNMASTTSNGNTDRESFTGGIIGELYISKYEAAIKNCANYGTISSTGTSGGAYLGGIAGLFRGDSSIYVFVQNCANYGTVSYNGGVSNTIAIGGVSGYAGYSVIDNCVSSGPVVIASSGSEDTYVGSIVGYTLRSTIAHCYWNMSIEYDVCDYKYSSTISDSYSFDPSSFELAGSVSIGNYAGTSLVGALNSAADYYTLRDYSHWALNKDSRDVSFTVNKTKLSFTTNAQVILLPDLAGEGNMTFSGWYTDSACTVPLTDFTIDNDEKKDLYGLLTADESNYTINFDTRGGSALSPITSPYDSAVELPTSIARSGCKFLNWENEYGDSVTTSTFIVPSRNITLYAVWLCERITTARDFIAFSDAVNSGTSFIEVTVYLDSDIDFTGDLSHKFEVIGKDETNYFRGIFDGQGHVIRNLAINAPSSYKFVGIFGYSKGTTIQNVVIDETCSVISGYTSNNVFAYAGGIIGSCRANDGPCTLENNVNMADITFNGNTGKQSFTGGIVGGLASSNGQTTIKNCANYGTVSSTGTSEEGVAIGGIAGSFQRTSSSSSSSHTYVQNCANYGTIFYNETASKGAYVGSISGHTKYSTIDNCVSSGPIVIVIASSGSEDTYIGSIVGYPSDSTITHCYWNMSIEYDVCDYKGSSTISDSYSFDPSSFELAWSVSIGNYAGTSLIGALNGAADYYILRDYSHWALNKDSRDVSFTVNGRTQPSFTTNAQGILLPDLAGGGNISFSGWYTDSACTVPLTDFIIDSDEKKDLYGLLVVDENNYTISFNTRGGSSISSITSPYGTAVELPNATRSGCKFLNWETEYGYPVTTSTFIVPSRNITLYAVWLCERITTARDLIAFSDTVNSGTNFKEATVYLDSDIDFTDELSQQFEVIGKNGNNYFRGTFDGRGHVIRNLTINAPSSYQYVGLFGGSKGTTIQNVVMDETCSVVNNYVSSGSQAYTGGIIGVCQTDDGSCALENNVNMADVTFNGNTNNSFTGGIVGGLASSKYEATIKNCANYGTVSSTGTSKSNAFLGGIDGFLQGNSTSTSKLNAYVQNCANYGTILYNGSSNNIVVGGISGYSYYSTIDNCVGSGPIVVDSSNSGAKSVGSIVGYALYSTITHSYWTLDVGYNNITGFSDGSVTITETTYVERLNTTTLDELNAYVTSHKLDGFSQWVMLHLNGGSVSNLTQSDLVVAQEHFPSPVKEGNTFLRWCKDLECGEVYDNNLTGITTLYAVWETVRVTFTFWNGTTAGPVGVEYGAAYGALPEAGSVVEGHTLRWFISNDDDERVVTPDTIVTTISDHTLHGRWVANNYTVTLDLGNGTAITRTLQYNESIELPQGIAREGCTHTGWDNSNTTNMPAKNITINALWNCTRNSHSSSGEPISQGGDKNKSSSNTGAIVGGVVGGLVGVVLIVLAVLVLLVFLKKKEGTTQRRRDGIEMKGVNPRFVEKTFNASEADCYDGNSSSILSESLSKAYPEPYRVPTIAEALYMAGLSEDKFKTVVELCTNAGKHAENEGKLTDGFGKEDAAAVALYTFDFGKSDYESNPYRIMNRALASRNDEDLKKASGLLYLVLSALRKLPRHTGGKLYRGVRGDVDVTLYKKGSTVVWHGLSSTSPDMKATKAFMENNATSEDDNVKGTLFIISNGWGYDIQPYSLFPDEAEILLEPEQRFKVQSVIEAELTVINLEMVDTPVILPEIFGENV